MSGEPVAITGIACRFPGGISTPGSFWEFVLNGGDAVRAAPDERKALWRSWSDGDDFPACGGFLDEIDRFDAGFFNLSPREARHVDPQQRILLELAWEALEDAGIPPARLGGRSVGVYIGIFLDEYWDLQRYAAPSSVGMHTNTGGTLSIAANRISYFLDFRGPSIAVDTACSSSLTALHLACRDIQAGTCTAALAGGANLLLTPQTTRGFQQAQMLSPDGRCRAFDRAANGYGRSDGAGMVVLKPLASAVEDGDEIYAVVHGSAINQDGRSRGLTVPEGGAQEAVIRAAARAGGLSATQLAFVEAHGTGTPTGDPVEAIAIGRATESAGCRIGSVKTNLGHTEAAAGIAGVIKTALALRHGILPPSLHFDHPNPDIPFEELGLRVVNEPEHLPGTSYAGVNSFGFGGANAHVVLGSPPTRATPSNPADARPENLSEGADGDDAPRAIDLRHSRLLVLSAHSTAALKEKAADTVALLRTHPDLPPDDLAATLALRRSHLDHRLALPFAEPGEAIRDLATFCNSGMPDRFEIGRLGAHAAPVVFVFTGMGPQWYGMGETFYQKAPVFRESLHEFDRLFARLSGRSILEMMRNGKTGERMTDVEIAQPANMALQWALAAFWQSLGVAPQCVVGHSVGEIAGACVAGALSLEEGIRIIYQRSRLQKRTQGRGEMLAVGISPDEAEALIEPYGDSLSIAAVNSPFSVTISGATADIDRLQVAVEDRQLFCRRLYTEIAYHSRQMDPIRDDFVASLEGLSPSKTRIPLLSTVTGMPTTGTELDANHWWRNIRDPVLFQQTFEEMPCAGEALYLQIGPHPVLSTAIYENLAQHNRSGHAVAAQRRDREAWDVLLESLSKCYVHGHDINWGHLMGSPRRSVPLAPYPWQKERYWLDGDDHQPAGLYTHPLIGPGIESSVDPDFLVWERAIGLASHPILADHRVLDRSVLPLAAQIEMLFETLEETDLPAAFANVELLNPLLLPETGARIVQLVRRQHRYTLSSKPASAEIGSRWLAHMRTEGGRPEEIPNSIDLEAVRSRCDHRITRRRFYELADELGFQYGAAFRQVADIVYSDREALAVLTPSDEGHGPYHLHPGVLDAGLQTLLMFIPDGCLLLPVGVKNIALGRRPGRNEDLVVHARLRETAEDDSPMADVYFVDRHGLPALTLEGITLAQVTVSGSRPGANHNPHGLCREAWVAATGLAAPLQTDPASQWFVVSDDNALGGQLAGALSRPGTKSELISISDHPDKNAMDSLADRLGSAVREAGSHLGVVGIWKEGGNRPASRHTEPALAAFALVRTILDRPELPCRLRLITAGAQAVTADDRPSPAHGSIWGCGRVVLREHPELDCTLIDLPAETDGIDVQRLAGIVDMAGAPTEVAMRGTDFYTRRIVPFDLEQSKARTVPVTRNKNTSYVLSQSMSGSMDDLRFETKPTSPPGPDDVVVRVQAAGLNFRDVLTALGMLKPTGGRPAVFGWECVGEVVAQGSRVDAVETGDLVMGMVPAAMAGHVTAKAALVARKPDHLGIEEAATLPVAFLTAYLGLVVRGGISAGDRVLVHNATGGVGLAALQIARQAEAKVFATAGSAEKRALLREMGVPHVMDSRTLDFAEAIMEKTDGKGVDIVLNTLSGPAMQASLSVLAPHGRFIEIGKTDLLNHGLVDLDRFDHNRSYHPIDLAQFIEEQPERVGELLRKILGMISEGKVHPLPYRTFPLEGARDAFRFMSQARHTGKLVLVNYGTPISVSLRHDDPVIRPGGTYLVTGGAGGIGRFLTRWLLDRGADLVIVTGRRPVGEAMPDVHAAGSVRYVQANVASREEMAGLLSGLGRSNGPLRGVFHAAGVLDDGMLLTQAVERFRRVLEPKTTGAWLLHELTKELELDFFVLFSSAASMLGTAGQAPYAAANAYLDSLADLRKRIGLPVTTINWGPWEDTGMTTDERAIDRLRRQGLQSIPPDAAGKLLDRILRCEIHRVGVVPSSKPADELLPARSQPSDTRQGQIPRTISPLSKADASALSADRLRAYIEDCVVEAICRIVEMDRERLETGQTWRSLGVDSLMAVELRNRIEAVLHVSVPIETLQSETAVAETVDTLVKALKAMNRT